MRPQHRITHPRTLHPGAWWLWALGLAAASTRTGNPLLLILIIAVTWFVVAARRDESHGAAYGMFFRLALIVIAIHVVLQAVLSSTTQGNTVLITLPQVPLPAGTGIKLGGQITLEAVLSATWAGLKLAAIFCCIGAANALGSAHRLLRHAPASLYELGLACIIALTFAPQLASDAARIRQAATLRGRRPGWRGRLRRLGQLAMPVVEGALERSVDLAAAMETRGYGRTRHRSRANRTATTALVLSGALTLTLSLYAVLTGRGWGWSALLIGVAATIAGLVIGGRGTGRTRYRPDRWALPEIVVAGCGMASAVALFVTAGQHPQLLELASPTAAPPVPLLPCLGILLAAAPAFLAPPLPDRAHYRRTVSA